MGQRVIYRYSDCFKRQVIQDLESGRFASIEAAREHYAIAGKETIQKWLKRFGRNDLRAKVVRVEKPDEADQIRQLKKQIEQLQRALGQTQAENVLNGEYLKLACGQLGQEVDMFKKKCVGRPCTRPTGKP